MKFHHLYILSIGFIILAAIMRPGGMSSVPADQESTSVKTITSAPPPQAVSKPYVIGVTLQREGDGHFYAPAKIDGRDIRFLVDTGASAVALTRNDAEMLGSYANPSEMTIVGRGVSGDVMGKPVIISSMSVGDLHAINVQAVIIPEGLDVSLLGQSFLSKVGTVNITDGKMTLQ
jgi:aspartyl protease family protein